MLYYYYLFPSSPALNILYVFINTKELKRPTDHTKF